MSTASDTTILSQISDPVTKTVTYELSTNKGKLVVTANVEDSKVHDVVLDKEMNSPASPLTNTGMDQLAAAATVLATKDPTLTKRTRVDFNRSSLERNFITPARALSDFLLRASDLESLPKIKRRSPYEQEPPITVYWRKDVESKAIEVWGSRENLLRECLKREIDRKKHQQSMVCGVVVLVVMAVFRRYFHREEEAAGLPEGSREQGGRSRRRTRPYGQVR